MKKIALIIAACIAVFNTYAQEEEHIETGRPTETQTPFTAKYKYLQIETGVYIEKTTSDENYVSHPVAVIKYGLSKSVELRMQLKYSTQTQHYIPNDIKTTGIEPVEVGLKVALCEEHGSIPKTSFIAQTGIPTFASKDFREDYLSPMLRLAMKTTISKGISVIYNVGTEWEGTDNTPRWMYTINPEIDLTKKLLLFVEAFGYIKKNEAPEHTIDTGLEYLISRDFAVDVAYGAGISKAAPHSFITIGGSIRFK